MSKETFAWCAEEREETTEEGEEEATKGEAWKAVKEKFEKKATTSLFAA